MPRVKQFDQEAVLDKAMHLFWDKGYHATSIQDLVDYLGINRASIYDTYGDKYQLYVKALKRYKKANKKTIKGFISDDQPIQELIKSFLYSIYDDILSDSEQKGCFMVNSTIDLATKDETTCSIINSNMDRFVEKFEAIFQRAIDSGELAKNANAKALSRYLFNTVTGIRTTARSNNDPDLIKDIIDTSLKAFNSN